MLFTVLRQNTHQLLERSEWSTELKIELHHIDLDEIYHQPDSTLVEAETIPVSLGAK